MDAFALQLHLYSDIVKFELHPATKLRVVISCQVGINF